MKITPTTLRPILAGALVGLLLTSCASEAVKAQAKKEREEKDKYVDYYPTGSNIPIKIPKDDAKTTAAQTEATQDAFRNAQGGGRRSEPDPSTLTGIPGTAGVPGPK